MAATLISLTVLLYIFRDFKKGLVLFGTFFFFLKYFPTGFGGISLSFAACVLFILFVIVKNGEAILVTGSEALKLSHTLFTDK